MTFLKQVIERKKFQISFSLAATQSNQTCRRRNFM